MLCYTDTPDAKHQDAGYTRPLIFDLIYNAVAKANKPTPVLKKAHFVVTMYFVLHFISDNSD
jgi:hypothetical protein